MKHIYLVLISLIIATSHCLQSELKAFDTTMLIRQKALDGKTPHEKKMLELYKNEMINELKNKKGLDHPDNEHFLSLVNMERGFIQSENIPKFFSDLPDYKVVTKLDLLPKSGMADIEPWASTWWPIVNGQTSVRYNKDARMNSVGIFDKSTGDYRKKFSYAESIQSYSQPNDYYFFSRRSSDEYQQEVNEVWSAAEKYDLLVGDLNFTYTKAEKAHGEKYQKSYGNVPSWFGYCHGWTPASYLFKRPNKTITLTAADGFTRINFLPDDIKGLAAAFTANGYYYTNFFGSPCNARSTKSPPDLETGLYTDNECNDIEPGSTLTVLANMIGILKRNVAFDPDPDFEIWNQPIRGYKVQYFNLMTNKTVETVDEGKILFDDLNTSSSDRFLNFLKKRSPSNTDSFIGIFLSIEYVLETELIHKNDYTNPDSLKVNNYVGAINLDANNTVLGGEWRSNHHPDFIWKISDLKRPEGIQDRYIPSFAGSVNELKRFTKYASKASVNKTPLRAVVEFLVNNSYVAPETTPLYPSIIPQSNFSSIGNGNPIINKQNGVFTVRSENKTIIFTGTAYITKTEPTTSYYNYIDPDNGVAYYSSNPFVFRTKPYQPSDDDTVFDYINNGNDPQIGAKKLVYCEGKVRYTMSGPSIISVQSPSKGNFFQFATKKGVNFYSLRPFSSSFGEYSKCNADDFAPGTPNLYFGSSSNRPVSSSSNDDSSSSNSDNTELTIKTNGRVYTLKGSSAITKTMPSGRYFSFTLPNGDTYYSQDSFKAFWVAAPTDDTPDDNTSSNSDTDPNTVKVKTNGRLYTMSGPSPITKTIPSRGNYFSFTLPNGETYYSSSSFTTIYTSITNDSTDDSSSSSNRNNDDSDPNTIKIKTNGREYTLKGTSPITKTKPNGRYFSYTVPNGDTYYSTSSFAVTYITTGDDTVSNTNTNSNNRDNNSNNNNRNNNPTNNNNNNNYNPYDPTNYNNYDPRNTYNPYDIYNTYNRNNNNNYNSNTNSAYDAMMNLYNMFNTNNNNNNPYNTNNSNNNNRNNNNNNSDRNNNNSNLDRSNTNSGNNRNNNNNNADRNNNINSSNTNRNNNNNNSNTNTNRNTPSRTNNITRVINGRTYSIGGNGISLTRPASGSIYYYDLPDGTRYYGSSPFSISVTN